MAIEIVDFPIKNCDFPWQNVSSPGGNQNIYEYLDIFRQYWQLEIIFIKNCRQPLSNGPRDCFSLHRSRTKLMSSCSLIAPVSLGPWAGLVTWVCNVWGPKGGHKNNSILERHGTVMVFFWMWTLRCCGRPSNEQEAHSVAIGVSVPLPKPTVGTGHCKLSRQRLRTRRMMTLPKIHHARITGTKLWWCRLVDPSKNFFRENAEKTSNISRKITLGMSGIPHPKRKGRFQSQPQAARAIPAAKPRCSTAPSWSRQPLNDPAGFRRVRMWVCLKMLG